MRLLAEAKLGFGKSPRAQFLPKGAVPSYIDIESGLQLKLGFLFNYLPSHWSSNTRLASLHPILQPTGIFLNSNPNHTRPL